MSRLERYQYDRLLRRDGLRLLKLHPANPTQLEIDCTLVESRLIDPYSTQPEGQEIVNYEAVSWCWGPQVFSSILRIHKNSRVYEYPIVPNLESALRAMRYSDRDRILWIDALCIDQANMVERNEQVPKMNQVYGQAERVCIWIGESYENSDQALEFIRSKVLSLWEFDKLCENLKEASNWAALINIMKRPWFSRRWVVQEIALAKQATLYCGSKSIDWKDFADAVSLFVEVESATHRLSEVMRRDQTYNHVPEFFGNVPALGAALLVNATSNLFRHSNSGPQKPLLGLEHLVSTYSAFRATQPRDTIYALLAISKDTMPQSGEFYSRQDDVPGIKEIQGLAKYFASKIYPVDYDLPVIEVFKGFVNFAIRNSDKARALDVICRPWAPRFTHKEDRAGLTQTATEQVQQQTNATLHCEPDDEVEMPSWIPDLSRAPFGMNEHPRAGLRMERMNANPLVGTPGSNELPYRAAETKAVNMKMLKFIPRSIHYSMFVEGFPLDTIDSLHEPSRLGNIPHTWLKAVGWHDKKKEPPEDFWRTLVADRGLNGRNPPSFYSRACRESMEKMVPGNPLDTKMLINEGQCTIVAEFLRRVQAVIWNRCLMRTSKDHLGLVPADAKAGDSICIFYGCSVPVVLRPEPLTADMQREEGEQLREQTLAAAARVVQKHWRRQRDRKGKRAAGETPLPKSPIEPRANYARPLILPKPERLRPNTTEENAVQPGARTKAVAPNKHTENETATDGTKTDKTKIDEVTTEKATTSNSTSNGVTSDETGTGKAATDKAVTGRTTASDTKAESSQIHANCESDADTKTANEDETLKPNPQEGQAVPPEIMTSAATDGGNVNEKPVPAEQEAGLPKKKYWRMIGECYVHGMMDGEAIAWQNKKEVKAEVFELR